jgi:hypothetical protein
MITESAIANASASVSPLILDCSRAFSGSFENNEQQVSSILDWLRLHPRRSEIHVVVRTSMKDISTKKLQSRFQAIGCTVTTKL